MKRIAIIGSGISGMAAAYLLSSKYDVTLFEKNSVPGGHTRTKTIQYNGKAISVDTGFIVFNHVNYPELVGMFRHLDVITEKSNMSFGFSMDNGKFEWGAAGLKAVFGQRSNIFKPKFYGMVLDVFTFFKNAEQQVQRHPGFSLGELLNHMRMGEGFINRFILPMGAAIWSCPDSKIMDFPASTYITFFKNHGLLSLNGQHQWYTVTGGAQNYVQKIMQALEGRVKLGNGVASVRSVGEKIHLKTISGGEEQFDAAVLASHADESLAMLEGATADEILVLGAFHYQSNQAYLHSDVNVMPRRKACWSSWNYKAGSTNGVSVTYWMNRLQNIDYNYPLFVTLNPEKPIDSASIFDSHSFTHPIFTREAIDAQKRIAIIQGKRNLWFCGAYQRYGFHEDGLMSAVNVAKQLGVSIPWH